MKRAIRLVLGTLAGIATAVMANIYPHSAWVLGWVGSLAFFSIANIKI